MIDNLSAYIDGLNAHSPLLNALPTEMFLDTSKFPLPAHTSYGWSLFLSHKPLRSAKIEATDPLASLPLGHIYPLFCSGLDIGYFIELPPQFIIIQRNMVAAVRRRAVRTEIFKDVTTLLKTKYITIFGSGDDAILIIANKVSLYPMKRSGKD
jgi:hypothetical protein